MEEIDSLVSSTDRNADVLLLVNDTNDSQIDKDNNQASEYVQLTTPFDGQQYVVNGNSNMEMELGDLLSSQQITLQDGELSVIEQDGQQYIVLPTVSMAEVLPNSEEMSQNNMLHSALTSDSFATSSVTVQSILEPHISIETAEDNLTKSILPAVPTPIMGKVLPKKTARNFDISQLIPSLCNPEHVNSDIRGEKYICEICPFKSDDYLVMERHMEQHRGDITDLIFHKSKDISIKKMSKKRKRGRKKGSSCRVIRTTAPNSTEIKKGPFECEICHAQINLVSVYKKHMKGHQNEKDYKCDFCVETFNIESNLVLHKALHADKANGSYKCPACQRSFSRIASLKAHLNVHFEEETMICTECGDEFALRTELDRHMEQHQRDLQIHLADRNVAPNQTPVAPPDTTNSRNHLPTRSSFRPFAKRRKFRKKADPMKCMFCNKVFQKASQYKRHLLVHTGEKPFSCNVCKKAFNQKGALQLHTLMHSGKKPHSCPHCPQIYAQKGNLRMHVQRVHLKQNRRFQCVECSSFFKRIGSLNAHITKYHINTNTDAKGEESSEPNIEEEGEEEEEREENEQEEVEINKRIQEKEKIDVIQQLLSSLDDNNGNGVSLDEATGELVTNDIDRDIVQQALQDSGLDSQHKITDEDLLLSTSPENETTSLSNHVTGVTDQPRRSVVSGLYLRTAGLGGENAWKVRKVNGVRWHQCMYCSKEFKKPSDLIRHIRTHTQERPYKCMTCHKSFAVKTSLTAHVKTHIGYKEYACQVCLKCFSTAGSLKVHIRLHTGARPYKCPRCDLSFRTTGHRHNHILSHARGTAHKKQRKERPDIVPLIQPTPPISLQNPIMVQPDGMPQRVARINSLSPQKAKHRCITCNKVFSKTSHLTQHLRTHTGEKPYVCTQCGKSFNSSSILKGHMMVHTGIKPFKCLVCSQAFMNQHSLKRHMTMHSHLRPYMCPYCHKTFKTNATCKKHINTHKNEQLPIEQSTGNNLATIDKNVFYELNNSQQQISDKRRDAYIHQNITEGGANSIEIDNQTVDFNTSSTLLQIDPNLIQNIHHLPRFQVEDALSKYAENHGISNNEALESDIRDGYIQRQDLQVAFKCSGCTKLFTSQEQLSEHDTNERENRIHPSLPCPECCHSLGSDDLLLSHMHAHDNPDALSCDVCGLKFNSEEFVEKHRSEHSDILLDYTCATCGLEHKSLPELLEHQKLHQSGKKQIIKRKKGSFYVLSEEQSEILERTDPSQNMTLSERLLLSAVAEKDRVNIAKKGAARGKFKEFEVDGPIHPHACKYCQKSFRKPSDLIRHERTHTGDKPFKCDICDKSFSVKSTLVCHKKSHSHEKIYRCHICDMMYAAKASLKVHMRLHTGAKPFKCSHCPLTFRTSGHRKSHMTTHFVQPNFKSKSTLLKKKILKPLSPVENTASIVWPDISLNLPVDGFLNTNMFQSNEQVHVPLHLNEEGNNNEGQQNITLQIDPMFLQSNVQENGLSQQSATQASVAQMTTTTTAANNEQNWPAPNMVIQPFSNMRLQPIAQSNDENGEVNKVQPSQLQEINIAVPSSLAPITQQILQNPMVISMNPSQNGNKQILSADNPVILQAVQQLFSNMQSPFNGNIRLQQLDSNAQDQVTFTLTGPQDTANNQNLFNLNSVSTFNLNNDIIENIQMLPTTTLEQQNGDSIPINHNGIANELNSNSISISQP